MKARTFTLFSALGLKEWGLESGAWTFWYVIGFWFWGFGVGYSFDPVSGKYM